MERSFFEADHDTRASWKRRGYTPLLVKLSEIGERLRLQRLVANPVEVAGAKRADGEVSVRFRDGRRLALRGGNSDYHVFRRVFLTDEYRLRGAPARDTVLDLGGNIGCFAFCVQPSARRVIVYEPDPANLDLLERNLAGFGNVQRVAEAVSGTPGRLSLHKQAGGQLGGRSTLFPELAGPYTDETLEVPVTTLDAIFDTHAIERCDLLKIDVEGAEYAILGGAGKDTLARVARIAGEYHDVRPDDPRTRIEAFRAFLESAGFDVETRPSRRNTNTGLFFAHRAGFS
jgi:FkbM family methyltransferase